MIEVIFIVIITLLIGLSLRSFFRLVISEYHQFSLSVFLGLVLLYSVIMCGFGLVYLILSLNDVQLLSQGQLQESASMMERVGQAIYFSGVTLLTVGYGDIIPIGWGRPIALFEALIGYTIPAALFVKVMYETKYPPD
ncbi:potassium channel family protein [Thalassobacillus hwangdonensis]|uniref:Potassium channel family protein n=1 Tax=Thalassobacillus hwangdonensis TaxID=546108 RepID=A0ABW3L5Y4_9BACI